MSFCAGQRFRHIKGLSANELIRNWFVELKVAAHNLKVIGSNPIPATKFSSLIKDFKAEHNTRLLSFQILVNTWSTFIEAPYTGNIIAQNAAIMPPPCMPVQAKPRFPQ